MVQLREGTVTKMKVEDDWMEFDPPVTVWAAMAMVAKERERREKVRQSGPGALGGPAVAAG